MKTHLMVTVAMVSLAAIVVGLLLILVMPTD
jgi:hypothetical protein